MPRSCAGSTASAVTRMAGGRATLPLSARSSPSLRERRPLDQVIEVRGLGRAAFAVICNGDPSTFAGPLPLRFAPAARFELGLDLVAPVRLRRRSVVRLGLSILTGRVPRSTDAFYGHNLDRIEVVCDHPEPLHADGEDLGDVTSAVFECQRSAVSVLV